MRCSDAQARILVVVVNYRTAELARACLRSLRGEADAHPGLRVVVVDNASGDGSPALLRAALEETGLGARGSLRESPRNLGFAGGNNLALREALAAADAPDFALLLNPDAALRPGAVAALLDFFARHPEAGIAGSRIEEADGTPQHSAFRFPNLVGEFAKATRLGAVQRLLAGWLPTPPIPDAEAQADWVSGACLMLRREVLEQVGLLDEGYFLYFEETDFCRAAGRAGWSTWYVPASRVVHHRAQATRIDDPTAGRRPAYWFESRRRFYVKNRGRLYAVAADLAWLAGHATWRVRRRVQRKPDTDPPHLLADFLRHSVLRGAGAASPPRRDAAARGA